MRLIERLRATKNTPLGPYHVNPDGPKAADRLEAMQAEIDRLREALAPFVEAAKMGVATYEAVKAANLRENGLSSYETVYVGAGVHAAESRVSYADWHKVASLGQGEA